MAYSDNVSEFKTRFSCFNFQGRQLLTFTFAASSVELWIPTFLLCLLQRIMRHFNGNVCAQQITLTPKITLLEKKLLQKEYRHFAKTTQFRRNYVFLTEKGIRNLN